MRRAVIVHHDDDMPRGARWMGPLAQILLGSGFSVELVSPLLGDPIPTDVDAVVVLGSEESAYDGSLPWLAGELDDLRKAVDNGTPVLGICFGAQVLARVLGGSVERARTPEMGFITIDSDVPDLIPSGPWLSGHYDSINPPESARVLARTPLAVQAFAQGPHLGVQFHPEATAEVLTAWRQRREATVPLGTPLPPDFLDLEACSTSLEEGRELHLDLCRGLVERFLDGSFARLAPASHGVSRSRLP